MSVREFKNHKHIDADPSVTENCPFCKKEDQHLRIYMSRHHFNHYLILSYVHCIKCGCVGPSAGYDERENDANEELGINRAVEKWNTREGGNQ